jgi:biopolymer transport protein ExbD
MAKKKRRSNLLTTISKSESTLEMTPMIDVTFLLLIFFMCTLKFKTLEGKLLAYLPKDVGVNQTEAEPIEKVEITLRVLQEGTKLDPRGQGRWEGRPGSRFKYADDRIVEYQVSAAKTTDLKKLQERLKVIHQSDPKRPATIDARKGTVYADVVKVLDAAIDAGFQEITFVGSYE